MTIKTFNEINQRIQEGTVTVFTVDELIAYEAVHGFDKTLEKVDVVTTATFGPMCSSGAFLNFGHTDPPLRMETITLNDVSAYGGLAAVDTYIGATAESTEKGEHYGGAHVISDLVSGKKVTLKATGKGTDCYPKRAIEKEISLDDLNEAYLYNPRNCYQNYNAAINLSGKTVRTYMGTLLPEGGNITYSTAGQLSPLLKDPTYRTIGIGTKVLIGGAEGYVSWQGTQFNSGAPREENGITTGTGGTLALIGNLKEMNPKYVRASVFEGYGCSLSIGVGIPIPVLDADLLKSLLLKDEDIYTNLIDYSVEKRSRPVIGRYSYAQLRSGSVNVNGKEVKTAPITSLKLSRDVAEDLKTRILSGAFTLQEPIKQFGLNNTVKPFKEEA